MSNSTTEEIGINDLRSLLSRTHVVTTDKLVDGEKGLSWDGHLVVYKNKRCSKSDFFGNIPVQVKTIHADKNINRFPISKLDLLNYRREGRILYFYVTLDKKDKSTIFYLPFQLWDIETCLRDFGNQEYKTFAFSRFPTKDTNKIIELLYDFIRNSDSQKSLIPGVYSYDDLIKEKGDVPVSFEVKVPKGFSFLKLPRLIKEQAPYLKYRSEDVKQDFVVDRLQNVDFIVQLDKAANVGFENDILYKSVSVEGNEDYFVVRCSPCFNIKVRYHEITFTYNFKKGTIDDKCKMAQFIDRMCSECSFNINGISIKLNQERMSMLFANKTTKANISFLVKYDLFRKELGISKEPDFSKSKNDDFALFYALFSSVIEGKTIDKLTTVDGYNIFHLFGLNLMLCVISDETHSYVTNWCDDENISLKVSGGNDFVSPYYYLESLERNLFLEIDNINLSLLEIKLFDGKMTDLKLKCLTNIVLNLISYYDSTNNESALEEGAKIASRLLAIDCANISNIINYAQILIRKKEPLGIYQTKIEEILAQYRDNMIVVFACNTILNLIERAKDSLAEINSKQKEILKKWPIYTLFLELSRK